MTSVPRAVKNGPKAGHSDIRLVGPEGPVLFGLAAQERLLRLLASLTASGAGEAGGVLVLRRDCLYSPALLAWLLASTGRAVAGGPARAAHVAPMQAEEAARWVLGQGAPPDHVQVVAPHLAGDGYSTNLRKHETPWCMQVDPGRVREAEWRLYGASYKGVTDFLTKYLWPKPAFYMTRLFARLGVSPNAVTALSALLVVAAFLLFREAMWFAGLAAAFAMTFLDTVDGKLARVTLRSSAFGNAFDHGIDLIHPPFWYWAWAEGLKATGLGAHQDEMLAFIIGGYVAGRLFEGWFIARHGIEMHVWRPFDSRFRLIVARRNPNLVLLLIGTLAGRPDLGFVAVAVWTAVSLVIHPLQIIAAERARAREGALSSWLAGGARRGA